MNKVVPKWVIVVNHPAKEITCKPSPVIFKISLILQVWCAVYFGKVLGLKEFCTGIHLSDLTHGHHHRFHFIHQRMDRSEEHTSELQSPCNIVCSLLLEKKKKQYDRFGLEEETLKTMDVELPKVTGPVRPARNTAVIVEVAVITLRVDRTGVIPTPTKPE